MKEAKQNKKGKRSFAQRFYKKPHFDMTRLVAEFLQNVWTSDQKRIKVHHMHEHVTKWSLWIL